MTIDVVIPIHGRLELTRRCLASLAVQTAVHRVLVVDNASPDESVAVIRAEHPETVIVELGRNAGFAAACNAGIAAGDGELVVLLNNDVEAEPTLLERLAAAFASDPRLGSAAPLLLAPGGAQIDSLGLMVDPTLAGFPRLQGEPAGAALAPGGPTLLGPAGAAAAYRRAALAEVGGLDERIFMYQEDVDVGLRLRAAGWQTAVVPAARAVHAGSASAGRRSAWQRERAGFARGYLLRRYGVLRSRQAPRAALTEALVVLGDALGSRDVAAARGRLAGWRSARGLERRSEPRDAIAVEIGLRRSIALRRADYRIADKRND